MRERKMVGARLPRLLPWCTNVCRDFCFLMFLRTPIHRSWEALAAVTAANNPSASMSEHNQMHKDSKHLATRLEIEYARNEATKLYQHSGTCAALALSSAVIAWQATRDWRRYRKLNSLDEMERWLARRRLFFVRSPVLVTALVSLGAVDYSLGGIRLWYWPDFRTL